MAVSQKLEESRRLAALREQRGPGRSMTGARPIAWEPVDPPHRPVLLVNPRSGRGAGASDRRAGERNGGSASWSSARGRDLATAIDEALAGGADALAVAGGDGSLATVAAAALAHDLPFVCVPAGTRNHFARDLGLDPADPVAGSRRPQRRRRGPDRRRGGERAPRSQQRLARHLRRGGRPTRGIATRRCSTVAGDRARRPGAERAETPGLRPRRRTAAASTIPTPRWCWCRTTPTPWVAPCRRGARPNARAAAVSGSSSSTRPDDRGRPPAPRPRVDSRGPRRRCGSDAARAVHAGHRRRGGGAVTAAGVRDPPGVRCGSARLASGQRSTAATRDAALGANAPTVTDPARTSPAGSARRCGRGSRRRVAASERLSGYAGGRRRAWRRPWRTQTRTPNGRTETSASGASSPGARPEAGRRRVRGAAVRTPA